MGICGYCISSQPIENEFIQPMLSKFESNDNDTKIIQITKESSRDIMEQLIDMMTRSFTGSTSSAPEGTLSWIQDPFASGDDPSLPLLKEPTEDHISLCRFCIKYCLKMCIPHRSCFALVKNEKIVCAALCCPPSKKDLHSINTCCESILAISIGVLRLRVMNSRRGQIRQQAIDKVMKKANKKYAANPHWYVMAFGTDPNEQDKGYGSQMMQFLTNMADSTNVSMYLETFGPANEHFYKKHGFEVKERFIVKTKYEVLDQHGGMLAMVRESNL